MKNNINMPSSNEQMIDLIQPGAISSFIDDLKKYDDQHDHATWMGMVAGANILSAFEQENRNTDENSGLDKLHSKIQSNLKMSEIISKHQSTLSKLGLDLESPNKEGEFDEKETFAIGESIIHLVNKNKYLAYLKTLDEKSISETEKHLLEIIVNKITRQVEHEYSLDTVDDNFLELLSGVKEIISEYQRLGLGKIITTLDEYQICSNSGFLKEYISARNHHIFAPIGEGFNLSTYHTDSNYQGYINFWQRDFFDELKKTGENPKANDLYNRILDYGITCINFAEKEIDNEINKQLEKEEEIKPYLENIFRAIKDTKAKITALSKK